MYAVKYKPVGKFITRYSPPYTIKDTLNYDDSFRTNFANKMFTDSLEKARKYTNLGHVKNSIGTNVSNDRWEIIELEVSLK